MQKRLINAASLLLSLMLVGSFLPARGEPIQPDLRGQVSSWLTESRTGGHWKYNTGLRYIPQLRLQTSWGGAVLHDLEISLNGYVAKTSYEELDESDFDLYRLKFRFATEQTETRLGLQQLNFGPAFLLRPLRWFDDLDPRDPLGLTDGVYALRFRYSALNNANLWLWGLYGNDEPKGYEFYPTVEDKPEFGGRIQVPFLTGEVAFTGHRRKVEASIPTVMDFYENRLALDGHWDIEIGLWFESVLQQQRSADLHFQWTKMMMLGADYTLAVGNGLHVLGEHMATISSEDPMGWEDYVQVSAFSLNYFMGYLDNLLAIGSYSWDDEEYYQYLTWQRTWDNWILNLSAFRYPESNHKERYRQQQTSAGGYGGQILIVFNH